MLYAILDAMAIKPWSAEGGDGMQDPLVEVCLVSNL